MKRPKLKPCPFCGNKEPKIYKWDMTDSYFIMCGKCPSYMDDFWKDKNFIPHSIKLSVVKYWNTRKG